MTSKQAIATQLSLLSHLPADHSIGVVPVARHLSLRPDLVSIIITKIQGDEEIKFQLPVQWTRTEAAALIHEIRGVVWQLGDDGIPRHLEEIIGICEQFCKTQQ